MSETLRAISLGVDVGSDCSCHFDFGQPDLTFQMSRLLKHPKKGFMRSTGNCVRITISSPVSKIGADARPSRSNRRHIAEIPGFKFFDNDPVDDIERAIAALCFMPEPGINNRRLKPRLQRMAIVLIPIDQDQHLWAIVGRYLRIAIQAVRQLDQQFLLRTMIDDAPRDFRRENTRQEFNEEGLHRLFFNMYMNFAAQGLPASK